MPVKAVALVIFLLLNRKLLADKEIFRQKFLWFYYAMIIITAANIILQFRLVTFNYMVAAVTGIAFWLMCIAAAAITAVYVKKIPAEQLHATLTLFFILNIIVSASQLAIIMIDSGSLNPYRYQGMYQKYFISTGDRITGISFDVSVTNALVNCFGLVYFLSRNKTLMAIASMLTLLLTTSNFVNILMTLVLLFIFIFQSTRYQKSVIIICFTLLVFFLAKVSPQNDNYMRSAMGKISGAGDNINKGAESTLPLIQRPDSTLNEEEKKRKTAMLYVDSISKAAAGAQKAETASGSQSPIPVEKPEIPLPNIHSEPFQRKRDTSQYQKELYAYGKSNNPLFDSSISGTGKNSVPGKLIAFKQTLRYLSAHPMKIFTGTGTGNFSSKLAFRATGLKMAGGYPAKFVYTHPDFVKNHLTLFLVYFSKDKELHSLVNTPNSVYDQLLAEYGLAGIAAFFLFYFLYFVKRLKRYTYSLPLLLILAGAFTTDYWFEQLSIVILFELMMLINIKETSIQNG